MDNNIDPKVIIEALRCRKANKRRCKKCTYSKANSCTEAAMSGAANIIETYGKAFALACRTIGDNHACPGCDLEGTDQCKRAGMDAALSSWKCWQEYLLSCVENEGICRICGCTNDNACDGGCSWVEDDLCSSCVVKENDA